MPRLGPRVGTAVLVVCTAAVVWSCKEGEMAAPEEAPVAMTAVPGATSASVLLTPACPKDFPRLWVQDVTAKCAEIHGATTTLQTLVPPATLVPVTYQCHGWGQSPPSAPFPNEWDQVFSHHPFSIFSENTDFVRVQMVDSVNYEFSATGLRPTAPGAPVLVRCRIDGQAVGDVRLTVTGPAIALTAITITSARIRAPQTATIRARYHDNYNGVDLLVPTPTTTWTSSNPAVATIASSGPSTALVTAVSRGTTTVTARSGTISATTSVTVTGCTGVAISPAGPLVKPLGTGITSLNANPACDFPIDTLLEPVTWSSTNAGVAAIAGSGTGNQIGRLTAVAVGTATVRACLSAAPSTCASFAVTVTAAAPLQVSIDGPTSVPRLTRCRWDARVTGGVGPYTYTWTPANLSSPANGRTFSTNTPGSGTLRITVVARDAQGQTASATRVPTLTAPEVGSCR
jgi:Bacterial Ig-like domain (group 2)